MINLSNTLTFLRAPLALLFLQENITLRLLAIFLAMFTDSIDGYIARKNKTVSKFGALLDPIMDKFFVVFLLSILFFQGNVALWEILSMLSRDFFLLLFIVYISITNQLKTQEIKPVRFGKVTTALQFIVLIGLTLGISFPWYIYGSFIIFGAIAFLELIWVRAQKAY